MSATFQLSRNALGRLVFVAPGDEPRDGVVPVRAFPISAPEQGIALVDADGHELLWIDDLASVPRTARALIDEELASRDFVPEIRRLCAVSSFATPSTWQVETDRGVTSLVLKGEEDIRRLPHDMLLVADSHGIQFLIRDIQALDRASRKLLDRFL